LGLGSAVKTAGLAVAIAMERLARNPKMFIPAAPLNRFPMCSVTFPVACSP
jgi:hypothetical protein